ncbi:response regulator transcription factor [Catellatospora tritici]|uniref:response regulator transcription factor n=1 Tax=Catellatospora tritici TaxID=2851566 RepID=UPI001C2D8440|nr:response regulator transcription factor [Catellatospora tritici]MBV1855805.1 response regulator transcription factor [Catellatospora tritici]
MTTTPASAAAAGRLLLIEDDDRIAGLIERALAAEGFTLHREPTGPRGLHAAVTDPYDLVILDLMLPDMDGLDVLHAIVEHDPGTRILVLSAIPDIATRVACLESGAADFLGKPFALAELVARIRARIRPPAAPTTDAISVGPVRLDLRHHRVEVPGRQSALSHREGVLLLHLMQHAGQTCSREQLLAQVWGIGFDPGSNLVDVAVRRLRAKLDHPDRIETVRHVGYRFAAN